MGEGEPGAVLDEEQDEGDEVVEEHDEGNEVDAEHDEGDEVGEEHDEVAVHQNRSQAPQTPDVQVVQVAGLQKAIADE